MCYVKYVTKLSIHCQFYIINLGETINLLMYMFMFKTKVILFKCYSDETDSIYATQY